MTGVFPLKDYFCTALNIHIFDLIVKLSVLAKLELVQTSRLRYLPFPHHTISNHQIISDITLSGLN